MFLINRVIIIVFLLTLVLNELIASDVCDVDSGRKSCLMGLKDRAEFSMTQEPSLGVVENRYLLYDVNPGEGFNLRRDVYMRIASLVRKLRNEKPTQNWVLVLPPWGPLYHWKSRDIGLQMQIPWASFFDITSLSTYVPVMEFEDFLKDQGPGIDELYYLQHYAEGWENSTWEERMDIRECNEPSDYQILKTGLYYGWFWGYKQTYTKDFHCLSIQGYSSTLKPLLLNSKAKSIMIDRAEVILHDSFGNSDYWMVRRSMRFAKHLIIIGDKYRLENLNSNDKEDRTEVKENWLLTHPTVGSAKGGPYIGVHLRRRDFVEARSTEVPGIEHAANQIQRKLVELNLTTVFIATDAPVSEFNELKKYLPGAIKFKPSKEIHQRIRDGGVAIIDQWICSHARYFIGTYESTFSFRIHEEREIFGFNPDTTFNRFCGGNHTECKQPARWTIVYP